MTVFVSGILTVLGSELMLHMFGAVALASGICFVTKAVTVNNN